MNLFFIRICQHIINSRNNSKSSETLQKERQDYELAAQQRNAQRMLKSMRRGQQLILQIEKTSHAARMEEIKSEMEKLVKQLAYKSTVSMWPLRVLPIVIRNQTYQSCRLDSNNRLSCYILLTKSNNTQFNKLVYPRIENELERFFSEWYASAQQSAIYMSGAWKGEILGSEIDIDSIKSSLKDLPFTMVIPYFRPTDGQLRLSIRTWGLGAGPSQDFPEMGEYLDLYKEAINSNSAPIIAKALADDLKSMLGFICDSFFWFQSGLSPRLPQAVHEGAVKLSDQDEAELHTAYKDLMLSPEVGAEFMPKERFLNLYHGYLPIAQGDVKAELTVVYQAFCLAGHFPWSSLEESIGTSYLTYPEIPFIMEFDKLYDDPEISKKLEEKILDAYIEEYYCQAETTFTSEAFIKEAPELKDQFLSKCTAAMNVIFSWNRFESYYKTIAEPFQVKQELEYNCREALQPVFIEYCQVVNSKLEHFIYHKQNMLFSDMNKIFAQYNVPASVAKFQERMMHCGEYYFLDPDPIAREYAKAVAERCNLFSHVDDDEGFLKTVAKGYGSFAMSIFENLTENGRGTIKRDVFIRVEDYLKWMADDSFKRLSFASLKRPKSRTESSTSTSQDGCYVTTAVCKYLGKNDKCRELQTLRWFRDNWILKHENGDKAVSLYYATAPKIVEIIQMADNRTEILKELNEKVQKAVVLVENMEYEKAYHLYASAVIELRNHYLGKPQDVSEEEMLTPLGSNV